MIILLIFVTALIAGCIGWVFGFGSGLNYDGTFEKEVKKAEGKTVCAQEGCGVIVDKDICKNKVLEKFYSVLSEGGETSFYCPAHKKAYEIEVYPSIYNHEDLKIRFYKTFEVDESGKIVKPKND